MSLERTVGAETLDHLPETDPLARESRRDLQRVHVAMGTRGIVLRALRKVVAARAPDSPPLRVLELGAGDGSLLLGVARASRAVWPRVDLTLLDRQALITAETVARYAEAGWVARAQMADVSDWARTPLQPRADPRWDVIVTTLFLHHFESAELVALLRAIASRADAFVACEPRRNRLALAGSHMVGALGANAVTREDAVLSVHAGFRGQELSRLWPAPHGEWQLHERAAGLFSHLLSAVRRSPA